MVKSTLPEVGWGGERKYTKPIVWYPVRDFLL